MAEITTDAGCGVDLRDGVVVEVEFTPFLERRHRGAAQLADAGEALVPQVLVEPVDQVFDDAETVVHHGGAHLHGLGAQREEFGGVVPRGYATDTADRDAERLFTGELRHHPQGDRLDRRATETAVAGGIADPRQRHQALEVDTDQALDRVDQRDRIGQGPESGIKL